MNDDKVLSGNFNKFNRFTEQGDCSKLKNIVSNFGPAAVAIFTD
jgi:hypothetical protein